MNSIRFRNLFILLISLPIFFSNSYAQFNERYFSDSTFLGRTVGLKALFYNHTFIVSGNMGNNYSSIICTDTNGNKVWQFVNTATSDPISDLMMGNDGFLYAVMYQYSEKKITYWKLNPQSGAQLWKKTLSLFYYTELIDYDSAKFLVSYMDLIQGAFRFAFINKTNGNVINSYLITNPIPDVYIARLALDSALNIYCALGDSVMKFKATAPDQTFWRVKCNSPAIKKISLLHYYPATHSVYAMGTSNDSREDGVVFKLNASNGNVLPGYKCTNYGFCKPYFSKIKNDFLYISWQHLYTGGGTYSNLITKYNLSSDTAQWSIINNITNSGGECVEALDIDDSGTVYATGYTAADNYGPGMLSVLKLEPLLGNVVVGKTIRETTTPVDDNYSNGFAIKYFTGHVYVIANLEPLVKNISQLTLFKLSSDSMQILSKKKFSNYAHPSSTLQIKALPNGHTAIFKQVGNGIGIEMYNTNKQLIWEKTYKAQFLEGAFLNTTPQGDIIVSALTYLDSSSYPFKSIIVDSVVFFRIDPNNGNILNKTSQWIKASGIKPVEMHTDDSSTTFLFEFSNKVYWLQLKNGSVSAIRGSGVFNTNISENTSVASYHKNPLNFFLFGLTNSSPNADRCRVFKINKNNNTIKDTLELPVFNSINYTYPVDSSRVILCGRGSAGKEAVGVYNTSNFSLVWSYLNPNTGTVISSCVIDPSATYLYTLSYSTSNILLRKFLLSNGTLINSYEFTADSSNKEEVPLALAYNKQLNRLMITGFQNTGSTQNTFTFIIDASFKYHWFIVKNNPSLLSRGLTIESGPQKSTWIGGYVNSVMQSGFVYTLADTLLCTATRSDSMVTSCGPYLWKSKWLFQSGMYYDTTLNSKGCDSIIVLNLNIITVDTSVTVSSNELTGNATGASFQWIDCTTGTAIAGQTYALFAPSSTGIYAVVVTKDGCSATSRCISVVFNGLENEVNRETVHLYPNPLKHSTTIEVNQSYIGKDTRIQLYNVYGQLLVEKSFDGSNTTVINRNGLSSGVYVYKISAQSRVIHTGRLVVTD